MSSAPWLPPGIDWEEALHFLTCLYFASGGSSFYLIWIEYFFKQEMLLPPALSRHSNSDGTTPENCVNASADLCVTRREADPSPEPSNSPGGHPWPLVLHADRDLKEEVFPIAGWKRHSEINQSSVRAGVQL